MSRVQTLQSMFKRYRRPGDIVFAWAVFLIALALLSQILTQTAYKPGAKLFAQPRFWPAVSLIGMVAFAGFHLLSAALSARIKGRWREVRLWISSLEYALWFIAYAALVPQAGYMPSTIIFAILLTLRAGYRHHTPLAMAGISAIVIVLVFKTFLQVKLPAGQFYNTLPDGLRQIMQTHF